MGLPGLLSLRIGLVSALVQLLQATSRHFELTLHAQDLAAGVDLLQERIQGDASIKYSNGKEENIIMQRKEPV